MDHTTSTVLRIGDFLCDSRGPDVSEFLSRQSFFTDGCVWKWLVALNPLVLLIIIPMKNCYFIGKINPTFSDKPRFCQSLPNSADVRQGLWDLLWSDQFPEEFQPSRDALHVLPCHHVMSHLRPAPPLGSTWQIPPELASHPASKSTTQCCDGWCDENDENDENDTTKNTTKNTTSLKMGETSKALQVLLWKFDLTHPHHLLVSMTSTLW